MTTITPVTSAHVTVYSGPVATGKTQALVGRAAALLADGVDPEQILVLVAAGSAAPAFASRLEQVAGEAARAVRVVTPQTLALQILDCDAAYERLSRRAHVLAEFEESFFIQDMLVSGKQPRRLREMLKFLERGWSELRDVEDGWLINEEERNLQAFACERLGLLEALHPCEVAAQCVRYLLDDAAALAQAQVAHVLVDDAASMARASQVLACLLAAEQLVLTWDPNGSLAGQDAYPYAAGLSEIVGANEDVEIATLSSDHASEAVHLALCNVLGQSCLRDDRSAGRMDATLDTPEAGSLAHGDMVMPAAGGSAPQGSLRVLEAPLLDDELPMLAGDLHAALDAGLSCEDVFVAVPSDAWGRRVEETLAREGVAVTRLASRQALVCDIRDLGRSADARMYVALQLVADPNSCMAWRCWCGFGDQMARSGSVAVAERLCAESGRNFAQELAALAAGERTEAASGLVGLMAPYREGLAMIEGARGLAGRDLVAHLAKSVTGAEAPAGFAALLGEVGDDEDAASLLARVERALHAPAFAEHGVRVGPLESCLGQRCQALYLAGAVNGLMPSRAAFELTEATVDEQVRIRARLARQLYGACGIASRDIVCSTFARAEISQSETLKLHSTFVRLVKGQRMCDLSPSLAIAFLQGGC